MHLLAIEGKSHFSSVDASQMFNNFGSNINFVFCYKTKKITSPPEDPPDDLQVLYGLLVLPTNLFVVSKFRHNSGTLDANKGMAPAFLTYLTQTASHSAVISRSGLPPQCRTPSMAILPLIVIGTPSTGYLFFSSCLDNFEFFINWSAFSASSRAALKRFSITALIMGFTSLIREMYACTTVLLEIC